MNLDQRSLLVVYITTYSAVYLEPVLEFPLRHACFTMTSPGGLQ